MPEPAVDDMRFFYPVPQCICATGNLGNHPAGDGFFFDKTMQIRDGNTGKEITVFVFLVLTNQCFVFFESEIFAVSSVKFPPSKEDFNRPKYPTGILYGRCI
jgi:hypothetical protein